MYHLKRKRQSNKTKGKLKKRKESKHRKAYPHESGAFTSSILTLQYEMKKKLYMPWCGF